MKTRSSLLHGENFVPEKIGNQETSETMKKLEQIDRYPTIEDQGPEQDLEIQKSIPPIEDKDPEFAKLILWVIDHNNIHNDIIIQDNKVFLNWSEINYTPERNEPCICGSGKKYKKCCHLIIN